MSRELPDGWFSWSDTKIYWSIFESLANDAVICEIGTWKGRSLASVADLIIQKNINVIAVDTFMGSPNDPEHLAEVARVSIYDEFIGNMEKFNLVDQIKVMQMDSQKASKQFPDNYFDFIFIDADHSYKAVSSDIAAWYPKLKETGIIGGHDFPFKGVRKAANEFFSREKVIFYRPSNIWTVTEVEYTFTALQKRIAVNLPQVNTGA